MKVLVLGGAGRLGRRVVWRLAETRRFEHIFVADEDAQGVNNLAGDLEHVGVSARYLDASDPRSIEERMREADVALGCAGPFHLYENAMVQAAIRSGTHYLSVCNDPAGTRAALQAAVEASREGVVIGTGLGWSPGLSNLLALHGAASMDSVRDVRIFWAEAGPGNGLASLLHYAACLAGQAPVRREGSAQEEACGAWEEWVTVPGPLRRISSSYTSHPEPITLPRSMPGIEELCVKGGFGSQAANFTLKMLAWSMQNVQPGTRDIVFASCRGILARLKISGDENRPAALRVELQGERGGAPARKVLGASGSCTEAAANLVIQALDKVAAGNVTPGVYPPEALLEPREAFRELETRGVHFWREER